MPSYYNQAISQSSGLFYFRHYMTNNNKKKKIDHNWLLLSCSTACNTFPMQTCSCDINTTFINNFLGIIKSHKPDIFLWIICAEICDLWGKSVGSFEKKYAPAINMWTLAERVKLQSYDCIFLRGTGSEVSMDTYWHPAATYQHLGVKEQDSHDAT